MASFSGLRSRNKVDASIQFQRIENQVLRLVLINPDLFILGQPSAFLVLIPDEQSEPIAFKTNELSDRDMDFALNHHWQPARDIRVETLVGEWVFIWKRMPWPTSILPL